MGFGTVFTNLPLKLFLKKCIARFPELSIFLSVSNFQFVILFNGVSKSADLDLRLGQGSKQTLRVLAISNIF